MNTDIATRLEETGAMPVEQQLIQHEAIEPHLVQHETVDPQLVQHEAVQTYYSKPAEIDPVMFDLNSMKLTFRVKTKVKPRIQQRASFSTRPVFQFNSLFPFSSYG